MDALEILFSFIVFPFGIMMFVAGAWALLWDARKSYLVNNFKDARVSKAFGIGYMIFGFLLWVFRFIWE